MAVRYPTEIVDLGDEVFAIDTRMAGCPGVTSSYLLRTERPCLIEVGAAGSAPLLRDALGALGVQPQDLATVALTHIHLDHAGGAGDIARMFGNAEVVVHQRGARHLAEPERLMRSARGVWGDMFDTLFGELLPTDAARIRAVEEKGRIDVGGGRSLTTHYTPGHAKHHIGLVDSATGDLYVGDAAGVYNTYTGDLRPATPPPDFDLDAAVASLRLFSDIRPQRLLFSHFGAVEDVSGALGAAEEELRLWVETVQESHGAGGDLDHSVALVRERLLSRYTPPPGSGAESQKVIEVLSGVEANTAGIRRWLERSGEPAADRPERG